MGWHRENIFLRLLLFAIFFFLLPDLVFSYMVDIKVVNGTTQGKVAKGVPVTLHLLKEEDGSSKLLRSFKALSDTKGFANMTIQPDGDASHIMASAEYRGFTYRSSVVPVDQNKSDYELSVNVYELSDEDGLVYIKERRIFLQTIDDGMLSVVDGLTIANTGNKTYVGRFNDQSQLNETARIGIPTGYEQPNVNGPVDLDQVRTFGNAMVFQEMIPPGEKMLFLSYKVRSDVGRFELHYPISTPHKKLKLLIPVDFEWNVKVRKLKKIDNLTLGQTVYRQWEGKDLEIIIDESTEAMDSGLRASIGFSMGPRIVLADPNKAGKFGKNEIAIFAAFFITILLGFFYIKKNGHTAMDIRNTSLSGGQSNKKLSEEKSRLYSLIKRLDRELDGNHEERALFKPHRTLILGRIEDIDMVLKNGKTIKGSHKA